MQFLKAVRSRGGVFNIHVVRATAKGLICANPSLTQLRDFDMPRTWVTSIYRRMGLKRRAGTTTRPPVPIGLYNECRDSFLRDVSRKVKDHSIPAELILNSDQTPSSYVSVGSMTMANCGDKSVPIKGLTDKRNITLTFVVTIQGEFLPMQVIYQGKTKASQPRNFSFPEGFSVSQNPKHWSNKEETLTLISQVINPYVVKKSQDLHLPETQRALLIWDVFKGQVTPKVTRTLKSLNIEVVTVPANMTHFFQPLDLTVNGSAKSFMKKEFITYYSNEIQAQLRSSKELDRIDVDLRLTAIKPLHAQWLVALFNYMTTSEGQATIKKGWERAGIVAVVQGKTAIADEDPFSDIFH